MKGSCSFGLGLVRHNKLTAVTDIRKLTIVFK